MGKRFLIYGAIGWCSEVFWTGLGSFFKGDVALVGFSSIWMFPIYGMLVLLEPIHDRIRFMPFPVRGGAYTLLIFAAEFTSGVLLRTVLGKCPWNYGAGSYTFMGLVTLWYAPVWFVFGLLFENVHDFLIQMDIGKKKMFDK